MGTADSTAEWSKDSLWNPVWVVEHKEIFEASRVVICTPALQAHKTVTTGVPRPLYTQGNIRLRADYRSTEQ